MSDCRTKCMYAMAGAMAMFIYDRYNLPSSFCTRCKRTVDRSFRQLTPTVEVPNQVLRSEPIALAAQRTIASAVDTTLYYLGLAKSNATKGGITSWLDFRHCFGRKPDDPLTSQLRGYMDTLFKNQQVLERFPVKPNVLSPCEVEFLLGKGGEKVCLGSGAMGAVFVGQMRKTGKRVAIKIATDERCDIHFVMHEASLMTHLNDTGAAPYCHGLLPMESDAELPMAAIVMDMVGESDNRGALDLQKFLLTHRNDLSKSQLRSIFIQIAEKVENVHQKGVIINDIKEQNILVRYDGTTLQPFLIDFGCGRYGVYDYFISDEVRNNPKEYSHMAPELLRQDILAHQVSPDTDIYSFGKLIDDVGRMLNEMVFMECGIFCSRVTPRKRLNLDKVRVILQKTNQSCIMENVITIDNHIN